MTHHAYVVVVHSNDDRPAAADRHEVKLRRELELMYGKGGFELSRYLYATGSAA